MISEQQDLRATASFGAVSSPPEESVSADEFVEHADDELYRAKSDGKNRVCILVHGS